MSPPHPLIMLSLTGPIQTEDACPSILRNFCISQIFSSIFLCCLLWKSQGDRRHSESILQVYLVFSLLFPISSMFYNSFWDISKGPSTDLIFYYYIFNFQKLLLHFCFFCHSILYLTCDYNIFSYVYKDTVWFCLLKFFCSLENYLFSPGRFCSLFVYVVVSCSFLYV